jgi:hypothetical protein
MINKGKINRSSKEDTNGYTPIDNSILQSSELSSDEICLLVHLISLPTNWSIVKKYLHHRFNMGRDKLDKAWKGLVDKGFIVTTKLKNGNLNSGYFHEVYENPKLDNPKFGNTENQSTLKTVDKESNKIENNKIENNNNIKNNINDTSIEKNNTTVGNKISLKEYREILNPYFNKHINWESDLLKYNPKDFISKYKTYYPDIDSEEMTTMINEFIQL